MTTLILDSLVAPILGFMSGSRLAKFQEAITLLRTAEARGAWASREAQKVSAGFYQGLANRANVDMPSGPDTESRMVRGENGETRYIAGHRTAAESCFRYGRPYEGPMPRVTTGKGRACKEIPADVVESWMKLCTVVRALCKQLDAARPKPIVTAIGLSPKVTKTLTEMNLDIDLPTITPAEIVPKEISVKDKNGNPRIETVYVVKWSQGVKLGMSRFQSGCEACGKSIPSCRFVPIEAKCRKNGLVGMWLGCDCARQIFGVKDAGISR